MRGSVVRTGSLPLLVVMVALGVAAQAAAQTGAGEAPRRVLTGQFHGLGHEGSGQASVYELADGRRVLRLEDLRTDNGPDLRVYLVEGNDGADDAAIKAGRFVDLGALKGNVGNQNYELPPDVDLERYGAVSIWCRRFGVNFAAASLSGEAS